MRIDRLAAVAAVGVLAFGAPAMARGGHVGGMHGGAVAHGHAAAPPSGFAHAMGMRAGPFTAAPSSERVRPAFSPMERGGFAGGRFGEGRFGGDRDFADRGRQGRFDRAGARGFEGDHERRFGSADHDRFERDHMRHFAGRDGDEDRRSDRFRRFAGNEGFGFGGVALGFGYGGDYYDGAYGDYAPYADDYAADDYAAGDTYDQDYGYADEQVYGGDEGGGYYDAWPRRAVEDEDYDGRGCSCEGGRWGPGDDD
jgi:hypothetical protein